MNTYGKVHKWKMADEQRLAYIAKNPIKLEQQSKKKNDFKRRGKDGSASRWGATGK